MLSFFFVCELYLQSVVMQNLIFIENSKVLANNKEAPELIRVRIHSVNINVPIFTYVYDNVTLLDVTANF